MTRTTCSPTGTCHPFQKRHFVLGSALEHQAEAARGAATETDTAPAIRMRDDADFPNLAAASRAGPPDPDSTFRHGLALIVAGLRARHAELTGTRAERA
ncbi:MAG: TetR/AcrR family transcriptional regulator C-terminal domain-containing protein [Pseudonocardiaceae bacterium]